MSGVLGWGKAGQGQLGLGGEEVHSVSLPRQVPNLDGSQLKDLGCGENHTLVCLKDGSLHTCGSNENNQLGHSQGTKTLKCVDTLRAQRVQRVCGGQNHSMALTGAREVFTWGSNDCGQLGRGKVTEELRRIPKLVKTLAIHSIIQIACGSRHCIALTSEGTITMWGANDYGQLGLGTTGGVKDTPEMLTCLSGLPVTLVSAGGNQSFSLSMSGAMHAWGRNSNGQLGLGDTRDRNSPTICRSLRSQKIKYVSCGEDHTAALTLDGRMFTFGAGSSGQLGHGNDEDVIVPRQVMELSGSEVTQIACGRRHTLAYVTSSGRLYSFGLGDSGQLGQDTSTTTSTSTSTSTSSSTSTSTLSSRNVPGRVQGPFVAPPPALPPYGAPEATPAPAPMVQDDDGSPLVVQRIFTGGDHCFLAYRPVEVSGEVYDHRVPDPSSQIVTLNSERLSAMEELKSADSPPVELSDEICKIFSHAACLNGSFLLPHQEHCPSSSRNHGVDMDQVRDSFQRLDHTTNVIIKQKICSSLESMVRLCRAPCDIEVMRVFLILPECHLFNEPKYFATLLTPFGQSILNLDKPATKFLGQWWGKLKPSCFNRLVKIYKQCVEFLMHLSDTKNDMEVSNRGRALHVSLEILKKLNMVNEDNHQVIPYTRFHVPELKDIVNIRNDYTSWIMQKQQGTHFCNYPFLFDGATKTILLQTDAHFQMRNAMEEVTRRNMMGWFLPIDPVSSVLAMPITRENIVKDTIAILERCHPQDLKKPLKVIFLGEEAVDEGGVRKEFFMLMIREVLDPKYGMFLYNDESCLMWFNAQTFEGAEMFHLIGTLCGLAIYNFTIIDLHFPLALFRKLLHRPITLEDLREFMPTVGRSLQQLLDYEREDVEDVFCLTFSINQEVFGEVKAMELVPGGADKVVTHENKEEYVDLYVDFILNSSVEAQFSAFREGFLKVCGGRVLELFHPQELQAMVIGNEDYDFEQLEKNTEYKGDYYRYHETIKFFWEVFHSFSLENKKKFLLFLTGSDRIPVQGMSHIKMIIQPTGGGEGFLPVAHTCFNLLDLPKYSTRQTMEEKLLLAIQHSEGFGIV